MVQKIWYLEKADSGVQDSDLHPLLREILYKRGFRNKKEITDYLNPELDNLHDPYLLQDMDRAVERIVRAAEKGEKIMIFGDYDVDGITSSALLYYFLRDFLGISPDYYLPDRIEEGYGLNREAVEKFAAEGYDLLLTVDCGITAQVEIAAARQQGLDIIVTDHHQPGDKLPPATALINPHRRDDDYPCKILAGVGVAFKFCQAICRRLNLVESELYAHLDLVALGTVADIVPLRGENRIFVRFGLKRILESDKPGLQSLVEKKGLDGNDLTAGSVGYILAPPLNAAGRMEDPGAGIRLLISTEREEADRLAEKLIKINRERQNEEERILNDAVEKVESEVDLDEAVCLVLASEDWHQGVIGIVASRLVEKYYLPTVLIAMEGETGKGSCRSIGPLDMFTALKHCSDYLEEYGGHAAAAGLELMKDNLPDFRHCFSSYIRSELEQEDFIPALTLDAALCEEEITRELYDELNRMRPFGVANPRPLFLLENITPEKFYCVGSDSSHLKMQLAGGIEGIGFGMGDLCESLRQYGKGISLVGNITLNTWNGREEVQINIKEVKFQKPGFFHPVCYTDGSLEIVDQRGLNNKTGYLQKLLTGHRKAVVYCNSFRARSNCLQKLPGNQVFVSGTGTDVDDFCRREQGLLFFSASDLSDNITAEDLILYSLPYSVSELQQLVAKISPSRLHFLFNRDDYYNIRDKIKSKVPTKYFLRKFYSRLRKNLQEKEKNLISISELGNQKEKGELYKRACSVLQELELIDYSGGNITMLSRPEKKLDLSDSLRYNKNVKIIEDFNELSSLVYGRNVFDILMVLADSSS